MESYIQISQLNDFIFCPKSIYFHKLYGQYNQALYHEIYQTVGKIKHEAIDEGTYSSAKRYIQGLEVFNTQYNICGKIDLLDNETHALIERKNKIVTIYDGYKYQLYGQYFCLIEMGYVVDKLFLHSLSDNKRYPIPLPEGQNKKDFESIIKQFQTFRLNDPSFVPNLQKCAKCVYRELCDAAPINF